MSTLSAPINRTKAETALRSRRCGRLRDLGDADGFQSGRRGREAGAGFHPDYSTRNFVCNIRNNSTSSSPRRCSRCRLHLQPREIARWRDASRGSSFPPPFVVLCVVTLFRSACGKYDEFVESVVSAGRFPTTLRVSERVSLCVASPIHVSLSPPEAECY